MDFRRCAPYSGLLLAVLTAGLLQAVLIARNPTITADGITFIGIARDFPLGVRYTLRQHDQHPGFPAAILAATRVLQSCGYDADPQVWIAGSLAITYVCGLLTVCVVWLLARQVYDARVANLAALIFAVLPLPRSNASDALSDTPHLLFYLLAAWLVSTAIISGNARRLLCAGICSGIAYWIRPEGLEVTLIGALCVALCGLCMRWPARRVGLASAAIAIGGLAMAAPYMILAGKVTSKQIPSARTNTAPLATMPVAPPRNVEIGKSEAPRVQLAAAAMPAAAATNVAPTAETPATAPISLAPHFKRLGRAGAAFIRSICQGFKFVFIPFYFLGYVELFRRKVNWPQFLFLATLAVLHIAILLGVFLHSNYIAHRHVIPLVALAMPWAGAGLLCLADFVAKRVHVSSSYLVPAACAPCIALVLPYTLRPSALECAPLMAAMHWVEERSTPGEGIICNSPYVSFYSKLPVATLWNQAPTLEAAVAKSPAKARYDYVVLHVNAHEYQPEWLEQLRSRYKQVQLFPDADISSRRKRSVVVFQSEQSLARSVGTAAR